MVHATTPVVGAFDTKGRIEEAIIAADLWRKSLLLKAQLDSEAQTPGTYLTRDSAHWIHDVQ